MGADVVFVVATVPVGPQVRSGGSSSLDLEMLELLEGAPGECMAPLPRRKTADEDRKRDADLDPVSISLLLFPRTRSFSRPIPLTIGNAKDVVVSDIAIINSPLLVFSFSFLSLLDKILLTLPLFARAAGPSSPTSPRTSLTTRSSSQPFRTTVSDALFRFALDPLSGLTSLSLLLSTLLLHPATVKTANSDGIDVSPVAFILSRSSFLSV
jgi:hypothetical protein